VHIWRSLDEVPADLGPTAVVIGNFDGVHLGHRHVLSRARAVADERGLTVVAITFDPHPMAVLRPEHAPTSLTSVEARAQLLVDSGADAVLVLPFDRAKPDYAKIVPPLVQAEVQAVIWIGSGTAVTDGIKVLRKAGSAAQVVTLSNNASSGFVKALGDDSRGVILTQVFPSERSVSYPLVKEAMELARDKGAELSPAMLEGFAAAKVLVEAIRRASPNPTRAKLIAALEKMDRFDLGGLVVSYGPNDHTGLDFADLSIIGSDGKFKR